MTIKCEDLSVFLDVLAGLVERGLTFDASGQVLNPAEVEQERRNG